MILLDFLYAKLHNALDDADLPAAEKWFCAIYETLHPAEEPNGRQRQSGSSA